MHRSGRSSDRRPAHPGGCSRPATAGDGRPTKDYRRGMNAPATSAAPVAVGHSGDHAALIQTLHASVGPDQLKTDPDITAAYSRDMMPLAPSGIPLAVVISFDTAQVIAIVRAYAAAGVPIVPR